MFILFFYIRYIKYTFKKIMSSVWKRLGGLAIVPVSKAPLVYIC